MFFMAYSLQPTVAVNTNFRSGNEPLDQGRKAGGHYAADLVLQLPARGAGSVAFTLRSWIHRAPGWRHYTRVWGDHTEVGSDQ